MTTTVTLAQTADEVNRLAAAIEAGRGSWTQVEQTPKALDKAIAELEKHANGQQRASHNPENQKPTSVLSEADIQQIENYANQHPDDSAAELEQMLEENGHDHAKPAKAKSRQRNRSRLRLAQYYIAANMLQRSLIDQYASLSLEERVRMEEFVFQKENLAKAQFTPEETREMLRRFMLLDRLVDPSQTLEEAHRQANQGFNARQDAEALMDRRDYIRKSAVQMANDQENYNEWRKRLGRTPEDEANTVDFTKLEKYLQKQFERALGKRREQSSRNANLIFNYRNEFGIVPQMFESENPFELLTEQHQIAKMLEQHGAKRKNMMGKIVGITRNMRNVFHRKLKQADELTRPQNPQVRAIGERTTSEEYARGARQRMERVL